MKKLTQFLKIWFKGISGFALLFALLGMLSLAAVLLNHLTYNPPIVPVCPVSEELNTVVGASDSDGIVINAAIRDVAPNNRKIDVRLNREGVVEGRLKEGDWQPILKLENIIPAKETGGALAARLSVFDTIPEGKYKITLIFVNDAPIPQTATCKLNLTTERTSSGAWYKVENRVPTSTPTESTRLANRLFLGIVPGIIIVIITGLGAGRFMKTFYNQKLDKGLRFLGYRVFGRPSTKRPVIVVTLEGELTGDDFVKTVGGPALMVLRKDNAKAVVLEQWGKITRVAYGSAYIQLKPFERIWDIIDLRVQRWVYNVKAITKDGIIIDWEADVQFRLNAPYPPEDAKKPEETEEYKIATANILKAATCKWIRDAHRTEPDRLMTWDKRVIIGAMEGALRKILAWYNLDDLLEVENRREIRNQLHTALAGDAPKFGAEILSVELHNITFNDKVLAQWFETWQTRRDAKVQEVLAKGRARRIREREQAKNHVQREILSHTATILQDIAGQQNCAIEEVSEKYVLLSFIEMLRSAGNTLPYMTDYMVRTLSYLKMFLISGSGTPPPPPGTASSQPGTPPSQPGTPPSQTEASSSQNNP